MRQVPIKRAIERVPGGLMVVPLLTGSLLATFLPGAPQFFGSFTGALFTGALPILAVFFVCTGASIDFRATPYIIKKGGTLFALAVMGEVLKLRNGATFLSALPEESASSHRTRERLKKYADYAALVYVGAFKDEADVQKLEYATLVRQTEFFDKVLSRVKRSYEKDALNESWLNGALPKIG